MKDLHAQPCTRPSQPRPTAPRWGLGMDTRNARWRSTLDCTRSRTCASSSPGLDRRRGTGIHRDGANTLLRTGFLGSGLSLWMSRQHDVDSERNLARTVLSSFPHWPVAHLSFDRPWVAPRPAGNSKLIKYLQQHPLVERRSVPRGGETRNASFSGEQLSRYA